MADFIYDGATTALGKAQINWESDTIKAVLCTSAYTASKGTDVYLSAIAGGARVATATLAGKSFTGGTADAADTTFTALTGSAVTQIVLYKDTGVEATSTLIANISTYTGLPYTPTGANLTIVWPNDGNKIFKLTN